MFRKAIQVIAGSNRCINFRSKFHVGLHFTKDDYTTLRGLHSVTSAKQTKSISFLIRDVSYLFSASSATANICNCDVLSSWRTSNFFRTLCQTCFENAITSGKWSFS